MVREAAAKSSRREVKHQPSSSNLLIDPFKANNAYELDKITDYLDWFNVMSYDYSGAWDPFTGLDQPLYGRWGEGFVGHPKYQFNIHETIQYYIDNGVPPSKLSMGIHTEGKGWLLDTPNNATQAGIYCPASEGSPNMTYSRQLGWVSTTRSFSSGTMRPSRTPCGQTSSLAR